MALGDTKSFLAAVETLGAAGPVGSARSDLHRVEEKLTAPNFPDFGREKVFGIGLSRTGTTSLNEALNILGYHSIHWTNPLTADLISQADFTLFDAFTDISVSQHFEWLFHTFPNSKFIYTVRDTDRWVKSVRTHYANTIGLNEIAEISDAPARAKFSGKAAQTHQNIYGKFEAWADAHAAYNDRVLAFFANKPGNRLLTMDITKGDGYEKLCPFLGVPEPKQNFPRMNLACVKRRLSGSPS